MGAFLRLGQVEGRGKGKELTLAAGQYYHILGGHFVKMSGAQNGASLCASGTPTVAGWVISPKQDTGKDAYLTVSGDKGFLINGYEDVFAIRPDETFASMAASWVGYGMGMTLANATYATIQKAKLVAAGTASPLACVDVDVEQKILYVRIKTHQPA